jgi:hypothetical protein
MVRGSYRLNRGLPPIPLISAEPVNRVAFFAKPLLPLWGIEWDLFLDIPGTVRGQYERDTLQRAYMIDGCLTRPLGSLPPIAESLAERTLSRGYERELPSGQHVAAALGVKVLDDAQIQVGNVADGVGQPISQLDSVFRGNSPLWIYVLAEAAAAREADRANGVVEQTPRQLGDVGGRIVAETFLTLLKADRQSILNLKGGFKPLFPGAPFDLAALVYAANT